eukprot:gene2468-15162_t
MIGAIRESNKLSVGCGMALRRADAAAARDEGKVLSWMWEQGTQLAGVLDEQSAAQYGEPPRGSCPGRTSGALQKCSAR